MEVGFGKTYVTSPLFGDLQSGSIDKTHTHTTSIDLHLPSGDSSTKMLSFLNSGNSSIEKQFYQETVLSRNSSIKKRFYRETVQSRNSSIRKQFHRETALSGNSSIEKQLYQETVLSGNSSIRKQFYQETVQSRESSIFSFEAWLDKIFLLAAGSASGLWGWWGPKNTNKHL